MISSFLFHYYMSIVFICQSFSRRFFTKNHSYFLCYFDNYVLEIASYIKKRRNLSISPFPFYVVFPSNSRTGRFRQLSTFFPSIKSINFSDSSKAVIKTKEKYRVEKTDNSSKYVTQDVRYEAIKEYGRWYLTEIKLL